MSRLATPLTRKYVRHRKFTDGTGNPRLPPLLDDKVLVATCRHRHVAHPPPAELRRQAAALNTMGKRHWKHIVCRSGKAKRAKPPQVGTAAPSVGAAGNVVAVVAGGAAATQDEPTHQYDEEHTTADGQEQQIPEDHEEAETSREIKKLRATVASLKSALARSRDQCARQRAKLRDLEVHSGNLVMQLQAEDSRWRKLCRTQKRKC